MIGSETARLTGLKVGDTFRSVHGTSPKGRAHDHPFRVTGIAKPVGGPYDTAIFIDMKDVWEAHGEKDEAHREVTALLVVPKGYKEAMSLLASYQKNRDVQMVFPSQPIISLYAMVGQTKHFWEIFLTSLLAVSLVITLLVMYWSGLSRMNELALLEALGAGKCKIRQFLLAEEGMLLLAGSAAGWLAGYGASLGAARLVAGSAAITMVTSPDWRGALIIPLVAILGTAAGLLPALLLGRMDVSSYL